MNRFRNVLARGHNAHLVLGAAAVAVAVVAGASFASAAVALLVLCPLAMGAMMWAMTRR